MKGVQPPYFCKQNRRHSLPVVQKQPSLTAKMVKRYLSFLAIMDGLKKAGDWGGTAPPCKQNQRHSFPSANIAFTHCQHGDDTILVIFCNHAWPLQKMEGAWGGAAPPPFANKINGTASPTANTAFPRCPHCETILVISLQSWKAFKKRES